MRSMKASSLHFDAEFPSPHRFNFHSSVPVDIDAQTPAAPGASGTSAHHHRGETLIVNEWELVEGDVPTEQDVPVREALFAVGNGHIGIRGFHEDADHHHRHNVSADAIVSNMLRGGSGYAPHCRSSVFESTLSHNPVAGPTSSHRGTYVNGVYDEHSTSKASSAFSSGCCKRECFLVAVPDAVDIALYVDEELVAPFAHPERVSQYRRTLDLKTGELRRRYVWKTRTNIELQIVESRFVCAARKHIAAFQYVVTCVSHPGNPTGVDVKVVSCTSLPTTIENAAASWEMENSPSGSKRQEDVSSVFCARTRGSRKHIALAVNDRCFVTTHSPSLDNMVGCDSSHMPPMGASGGTTIPGHLFGGGSSVLPSPMGPPMPFGSPPPLDPLQTLPMSRSVTNATAQQSLNAATFISPLCNTPMRPPCASTLGHTPPQTAEATEDIPKVVEMVFRATLLCGEGSSTLNFAKTVAYVTDADCEVEDMEAFASEMVENAVDHRYDGLLAEQQAFMDEFWNLSDVIVSCSKSRRLQGTLRFNILQIFMSTGRWKGTGVGPRGLTGEVFNGLQTWDAEIFIFPFFLHSHPHIARSLLQFRVDTLPEAQRRAYDFELPRGAIYPSRTINGAENAPSLPCALHLHVNADIAYAMKQYYEATCDLEFMLNGGIEVVWSTAIIWLLWGAWEYGSFHIRSVTGPDEYNVLVHDNFFTNIMARHHMCFAVEMYEKLKSAKPPMDGIENLMLSASVTAEDFVAMKKAADKMALPYDPHHRIHLQDAGFLRKRGWEKVPRKENVSHASPLRSHVSAASSETNLDTLSTKRPHHTDATSVHGCSELQVTNTALNASSRHTRVKSGGGCCGDNRSSNNSLTPTTTTPQPYMHGEEGTPVVMIQEYHPIVVFRHRICKNADVVLSAVLLRDKFTHDEKEANFRFYERLTAHDSSLTAPLFSIAASDIQLREEALEYFKYALYIDMNNVLKNTSGGLHLSCLGGSWWCIVAGFAGFCVLDGVAHFNPWIPDGWNEYKFQVRHHGTLVHVAVTRRSVAYSLVEGSKLLIVHAQSARVHLARGRAVSIKLVRDVRSIDYDAVIFDLDSIIDSVEEDQFNAWSKTLDPLFVAKGSAENSKPFNNEMYLAYLRHHPISQHKRYQGLQRLLLKRGIEMPVGDPNDAPSDTTLYGLISRKLQHFRSIVKARGVHLRKGVLSLISDLKENGVMIGVVSASKNGQWMMQQASGIHDLVDSFIDANVGELEKLKWRPELDFFDCCARRMDISLDRSIIFVDGIDGFSKRSLLQYWLIVNTSLEEGGLDSSGSSMDGISPMGGGGGGGALADSEEVPQVHVRDLSGLSTDVLHERGTSVAARGPSSTMFPPPPLVVPSATSPQAPIRGNSSFAAIPSTQSIYV